MQTMKMRRNGALGPLAASLVAAATRRGPGPVAMPAQQQSQEPVTCHAALVSLWPSWCSSTAGALFHPDTGWSPPLLLLGRLGLLPTWGGREKDTGSRLLSRQGCSLQSGQQGGPLFPKSMHRPQFWLPSQVKGRQVPLIQRTARGWI